jgi:signal transduction histidine kinase
MSQRRPQKFWWLAPQPFDWVSSALYLSILLLVCLKLGMRCPCVSQAVALGLTATITGILLTLLAIDRVEYARYSTQTPRKPAIALLLTRMLLIEAVTLLEPLYFVPFNYAVILYLIPPYLATHYFGSRTGTWITLLAGALYVGQETLYSLHPETFSLGTTTLTVPPWYNNPLQIFLTIIFCLALVFLLTMARVVSQEQASRAHTEQLLKELARSHQQLSLYAEQVAELATIKERTRIARDIHDSLGHALIAITVQLEKALVYFEQQPQEAIQAVSAAKQVAKAALGEVRSSVRALRLIPPDFSCTESIALLVQQLRTGHLMVEYSAEGDEAAFSQPVRLTLYRVAQEGFTNIQKHAQAAQVQIDLHFDEQEARLHIQDNGCGFEDTTIRLRAAAGADGYGLPGMRERLELVGGHLRVESHPGQGTTLRASVPRVQPIAPSLAKEGHSD